MADEKVFILSNGRMAPDATINPDNVPSTDQKAALAGDPSYPLSDSDRIASVGLISDRIAALDPQDSVQHGINYVKTTAGAPSGTPEEGEKCLNTNEAKLYEESAGSWDAGAAVSAGDRFLHRHDGGDTSGDSGTYTADGKLYDYNGSTFDEKAANHGQTLLLEDANEFIVYDTNDSWVQLSTTEGARDAAHEIVDMLPWARAIDTTIHYIHTAPPTGTPSTGERCLDTTNVKIYEESGGAWGAAQDPDDDTHYVFKDSGSDTSGNSGTYTATNSIYHIEDGVQTIVPENWETRPLLSEDQIWWYDHGNTMWKQLENSLTHADIGTLQGGTTNEYYHLTADQNAAAAGTNGSPSAANKYVTDSDPRIPTTDEKAALAGEGAPSAANKYTCKSYVDGLSLGVGDWQDSVEHSVDYVKTDAGAPSGTATSGEKCLNTNEDKLYTYTTSWDAGVASVTSDRYVHKDTGSDASGDSGTYTKSDKIYDYNGATYDETVATEGMAFWAEDEDVLYTHNGTDYVKFGSTVTHNNTAGKQGGTTDEYYHITANQEAGMDAAAEAITSTNPPLTKADKVRLPDRIVQVRRGGVGQSQSNVVMYDSNDLRSGGIRMHKAGYIVGLVVQSSGAPTAGVLTAKPHVNGAAITPTGLNTQLSSGTQDNHSNVAEGVANYNFAAGAKVGILLDTDASWAAGGSEDISGDLLVVYTG